MISIEPYIPADVAEVMSRARELRPTNSLLTNAQYLLPYGEYADFVIRGTAGATTTITVNGSVQYSQPLGSTSEIVRLLLEPLPVENVVRVSVPDQGIDRSIVVALDVLASILMAVATELRAQSARTIESVLGDLTKTWSSARWEPLLPYGDLLPDLPSQRTMRARLFAAALINRPGTTRGVTEALLAATGSTPIFEPLGTEAPALTPMVVPTHSIAFRRGYDAHVWLPNVGAARWVALQGLIGATGHYATQHLSDDLIIAERSDGHKVVVPLDTDNGGDNSLSAALNRVPCSGRERVTVHTMVTIPAFWSPYGIPLGAAIHHPGVGGGGAPGESALDAPNTLDKGLLDDGQLDQSLVGDLAPEALIDGWELQPLRGLDSGIPLGSSTPTVAPDLPSVTGPESPLVTVLVTTRSVFTTPVLPPGSGYFLGG